MALALAEAGPGASGLLEAIAAFAEERPELGLQRHGDILKPAGAMRHPDGISGTGGGNLVKRLARLGEMDGAGAGRTAARAGALAGSRHPAGPAPAALPEARPDSRADSGA